ncbi:hypothetical protein [Neptuniibacter sp. QD37_11]|uniref:hypothetical protein n=1 Tax=Neptuniibacter sp. QD37_11 TaxID=3398209 RepID=UPI0039F54D21
MQINIHYEGSWRNSFIEPFKGFDKHGMSNKRKYTSSLKALTHATHRICHVSDSTVAGLLYRLCGATQKLARLEKEDQSVLAELLNNGQVAFNDVISDTSNEIVYLRNINGSTDPSSYAGVIDNSLFKQPHFAAIFAATNAEPEAIIQSLVTGEALKGVETLNVLDITKGLEALTAPKFHALIAPVSKKNEAVIEYITAKHAVEDPKALGKIIADEPLHEFLTDAPDACFELISRTDLQTISDYYQSHFPDGLTLTSNLGLACINIASKLAAEAHGEDEAFMAKLSRMHTFSGISANAKTFTPKDFFKKFAQPKIVYGNPYRKDLLKKGEKPQEVWLVKCNGDLTIDIDCTYEQAQEIKQMIDDAAVSSFYLGKKGLGYVTKIIT